jgi:hypothetical protein
MENILFGGGLVLLLNSFPIKINPSIELDFAGRIINTYQIIAHVGVGMKYMGFPLVIFGSNSDQLCMDFVLSTICDYIGWLAIFTRLKYIPWFPKSLANSHISTAMLSLLNHQQFQNVYIRNNSYEWNLVRAAFVFSDALVRGYYQFFIIDV